MQALRKTAIFAAVLTFTAAAASAQISKWQIDPAHSEAGDFECARTLRQRQRLTYSRRKGH
jgi:hypothetical protein